MHENKWIEKDGIVYPGIVRGPSSTDTIVILFSGLGFPMSDRDYFMSRIATEIQEFATVYQFDLRGHGDHSIDLEQTTLNGMKADICNILQEVIKECEHPVSCIARGISPLLCMQVSKELGENTICGIIGFNPYMIDNKKLKTLFYEIYSQDDLIAVEKYSMNPDFKSVLRAMGADIEYIKGESIPVEFFRELDQLEAIKIFNQFTGKKVFLYPKYDKNYTLEILQGNDITDYRELDKREDAMLPYNSFWQSESINVIKQILLNWSEDNDK